MQRNTTQQEKETKYWWVDWHRWISKELCWAKESRNSESLLHDFPFPWNSEKEKKKKKSLSRLVESRAVLAQGWWLRQEMTETDISKKLRFLVEWIKSSSIRVTLLLCGNLWPLLFYCELFGMITIVPYLFLYSYHPAPQLWQGTCVGTTSLKPK